jgi:hypothetical protein
MVIPYVISMMVAASVLAHGLPHSAEQKGLVGGSLSKVVNKLFRRLEEACK